MTSLPARYGRRLALAAFPGAACLVLAVTAGCTTQTIQGPLYTPAPPPPAPADLTRALLDPADLTGLSDTYRTDIRQDPDKPTSATRPECQAALDQLELDQPSQSGVVQARANFAASDSAASDSGPWLQEVIRSYPGDGAANALSTAQATLAGCGTFTVGYPDGSQTQLTVQPVAVPHIGDQDWAVQITADTGALRLTDTLVLARVKDVLLIVSHATTSAAPIAEITTIANRAVAKLATS